MNEICLLIGSTKTATTSIDKAVRKTGCFRTCASGKETNFLLAGKEVLGRNKLYSFESLLESPEGRYVDLFSGCGDIFEACTSYFHFAEEFVEKSLAEFGALDNVRLILILRSPHSRAFSAYKHSVRDGVEDDAFADALRDDFYGLRDSRWFMERYFKMSLYYDNVLTLMNSFKNLSILDYDALVYNESMFYQAVSTVLGCEIDEMGVLNSSSNPYGRFDLYADGFIGQSKKYIRMLMHYLSFKPDVVLGGGDCYPKECVSGWVSDLEKLEKLIGGRVFSDWKNELLGYKKLNEKCRDSAFIYRQGDV